MSDPILVCDRVMYAFAGEAETSWRVDGHMKRIDETRLKNPYPPGTPDADIWSYIRKSIRADIARERKRRKKQGLPHTRRYRLVWCKPEEATHLSLYAVCGAIAPIEKCRKVGTVEWDAKTIEDARKSALLLIQTNDTHPIHKWE
jgi:hypothetical protein